MNKLGYLGSFVAGCGIGALVAWVFTKKKYEELVESEIQSVKDEFAKESHIVVVDSSDQANKTFKQTDVDEYKEKVSENHYTNYKKALEELKDTAKKQEVIFPYPIEQDERGENGFVCETVIWYEGDEILADEMGKIFERPDEVIGFNNLESFGDSDVIFIRNETDEVDYEVIRDSGNYSDAYGNPNYIQPGTDE